MAYCSKCGAPLPPGTTECEYCGSTVEEKYGAPALPAVEFKYVSTFMMMFLTVITWGLYSRIWYFLRRKELNRLAPPAHVSDWALVLLLISGCWTFFISKYTDPYVMEQIRHYMFWLWLVMSIFMAYQVRSLLRAYVEQRAGDSGTAALLVAPSDCFLCCFGVLYIQSQINAIMRTNLIKEKS